MDRLRVCEEIRRLREGYGFSPQELAHLAQLAPARIDQIEAGAGKAPSTWEIAALADALATDPAALWRGDASNSSKRSTARFRAPQGAAELRPHDARLLARAAEAGRLVQHLRDALGDAPSPLVEARRVLPITSYPEPWDQGYRLGREARQRFAPSKEPIVSIERLLEELGVHIARVELESRDILAASLYEPKAAPVIVLNVSARRVGLALPRRAVLAHELCHLLHDSGESELLTLISRQNEQWPVEQRANGFAPSFLVPGGWLDLAADEPRELVVAVATRWGLSFEGAAWHAKNAQRIDPLRAQQLVERPVPIPAGQFEPEPARRSPASLGLDVEASPLTQGLLAEVTLRALEAELISAGRAKEILTLR